MKPTTLKKRLEEKITAISVEENVWWVDTDNSKWNATNNLDYVEKLAAFMHQELMALAEATRKLTPNMLVLRQVGQEDMDGFYIGLNAAADYIENESKENFG